ncbi:hypothetical protein JCM17846_17330 [Iodidimonas nitroreducens]|uniref:Uncharacterized protein n=1 Tax=Iodidimonas nitroreducens TaxID=1236968 RepID=A0A5A7N6V9_9PROT|nr:hypothetical protein [Iodidimonas nitroreducens]GER04051.1 hypothetical protein JCM17846_17330 [Iodidimonas nitroreducens]
MDEVMQNAPPDLLGVAKALIERHGHYGQIPDIHMEEAGRLLDDCMGLIFPHLSPHRPKSAREIEAG